MKTCLFIPGTSENIAKGQPAWQSSVYQNYDAHLAVDGNAARYFNSRSCAHTQKVGDVYWAVDLGQSHWIKSFKITNRADICCGKFQAKLNRYGVGSTFAWQ